MAFILFLRQSEGFRVVINCLLQGNICCCCCYRHSCERLGSELPKKPHQSESFNRVNCLSLCSVVCYRAMFYVVACRMLVLCSDVLLKCFLHPLFAPEWLDDDPQVPSDNNTSEKLSRQTDFHDV